MPNNDITFDPAPQTMHVSFEDAPIPDITITVFLGRRPGHYSAFVHNEVSDNESIIIAGSFSSLASQIKILVEQ